MKPDEILANDRGSIKVFKEQLVLSEQINSLNELIGTLQDSMLVLERGKTDANRDGYETAYETAQEYINKYIQLLEKPPKISFTSVGTVLGSVGLGVLIGTQIKR